MSRDCPKNVAQTRRGNDALDHEATMVSLFLAMAWETAKIILLRILNAAFPSGQNWFFLSVTWSHFAKNVVIFWLLAFMYILLMKIALICPGLSKTWYQ